MFNKKSRKKVKDVKGEQNALPILNENNVEDEFIIKDLGVNKEQIKNNKILGNANKINLKLVTIIALISLLIATAVFTIRFINFDVTEMIWKTNVAKGSDRVNNKSIKYCSFENGLMRISNDGVTYISDSGEAKWTISYNMKDPIYDYKSKYFAIADRNGNEFCIFDKNGETGNNLSTNAIKQISLSSDGVLYILQNDESSSYINLYRHNGNAIDIAIKSTLTGDGMPIDISTSDDGLGLSVVYVCLDNNDVYTKATYYNFDEVGKLSNSKRIVGEFVEEFKDRFLARCHYFDSKNSCLIFDGGVYFVSTSNPAKPRITVRHEFSDRIRSVSYNEKYLAFVFENNKLMIIDKKGNILAENSINSEYENFYLSDNYVVFIYENKVKIFDDRGRVIFDKEMAVNVQYIAKKKSIIFSEFLLGSIDSVECIRFY